MKTQKKLLLIFFILALLPVTALSAYAAPQYNDVPPSHPAYSSIVTIAQKGILVSDASGNYRPDDLIDKFETSKILAKLSGYKMIDFTDAERDFYERSYEKNKGFISQYGKSFKKWNTSADREIAFLIEKEILTPEDLNQFVVIRTGEERIRALSREEAMVFMVKLMGKKTQALSSVNLFEFGDDLRIAAAYKPYVYYMKNAGLIQPDSENNFYPKQALTRADMAVLLDRVIAAMENLDPDNWPETGDTPRGTLTQGNVSVIESASGVFDRLFETETDTAIQIIGADGIKHLYKVSPSVTVYIDGFLKNVSDLTEGVSISAVLNNLYVIEIKAQTKHQPIGGADTGNAGTAQYASGPVALTYVEGAVVSVSASSVTKTIIIEVRTLNAGGQIITDQKTYAIQDDCGVTRAGEAISLSDIKVGDICRAEISGARVYSLHLEPKFRDLEGRLLQKKNRTDGGSFVIESAAGTIYELYADGDTMITRGHDETAWHMLRVGDMLTIRAEYDKALSISASGSRSSVTGIIEEVRLTRSGVFILFSSGGAVSEYPVIMESVDVSLLNVGARATLFLDSSEAYAVNIHADGHALNTASGVITAMRGGSVTIRDVRGVSRDIHIISTTSILDATTGLNLSPDELTEGAYIYAYIEHNINAAVNITVIQK